jgi:excinuclease UvrABC ATPase subunit
LWSFPRRNRCWIWTLRFPCLFFWTGLWSAPENRARIVDAAEIAYREGGEVIFEEVPRDEDAERNRHRFSAAYECKSCHRPGKEPEPRLFSFNNPFGACPRCQGFGNTVDFDMNLVIPDKGLTLEDGAIDPWNRPKYRTWFTELRKQAPELGVPLDVPWRELPERRGRSCCAAKEALRECLDSLRRWSARSTSCTCA